MGKRLRVTSTLDFDDENLNSPKLEELSLADLKNIGKMFGLHVAKYNNRDKIVADLYPIINGLKVNEDVPERVSRYTRVTDKRLLPEHRYGILSYEGKGAVTGGLAVKGVFHYAGRDGYISKDFIPASDDVLVIDSFVKKYDLAEGDYVIGRYMYFDKADVYVLIDVISVNGKKPFAGKSAEPKAVPPREPISLWDERSAYLRAIDAVCPPCPGESLLVTHPARYRSPEILLDASKRIKESFPETELVSLYLAPPAAWREAIGAAGGVTAGAELPEDFVYEAAEVACARAEILARSGKKVLLTICNLEYLAGGGAFADVLRAVGSAAAYDNGGSLTFIGSLNTEGVTQDKLGLIRGFVDSEFSLECDGEGICPDFLTSNSSRYVTEGLGAEAAEIKRYAAAAGNRAAFKKVTAV